jgi:hypothetical protein
MHVRWTHAAYLVRRPTRLLLGGQILSQSHHCLQKVPVACWSEPGDLNKSVEKAGTLLARTRYFPSMFAALRMGDQRAISALTKPLNFVGVRSPLLGSDPPRSASRAWTPGLSSA